MEVELTPTLYVKITVSNGTDIRLTINEARELRDWLLAEKSITPSIKALKPRKPKA